MAFQFTDYLRSLLTVRQKSEPFGQQHFDFAASVQQLSEQAGIALATQAIALTGVPNLALAGGVGLNGLMNEAIRQRSGCCDLFVYPAASDDGCAVGAAQWLVTQQRSLTKLDVAKFDDSFLGVDEPVKQFVRNLAMRFKNLASSR